MSNVESKNGSKPQSNIKPYIGLPKTHGMFRSGLPKMHGRLPIGLPKVHRRFRIVSPKVSTQSAPTKLPQSGIPVYHS